MRMETPDYGLSKRNEEGRAVCLLCPHHCALEEGQMGLCRARKTQDGKVLPMAYGEISVLALDPIEKKPLRHFFPGTKILSVGMFGCNMRCRVCQNYAISMQQAGEEGQGKYYAPREIADLAVKLRNEPLGNLGMAFTYNEPLIAYEFLMETAPLLRERDLKLVLVTNGMIAEKPLRKLLPYVDAMNIDLKAWDEMAYRFFVGKIDDIRETIKLAVAQTHVEITTLLIPDFNDHEEEMDAEARWLASLSRDIPLHVTRYFPNYPTEGNQPTSIEKVKRFANIARRHLRYVYEGNI